MLEDQNSIARVMVEAEFRILTSPTLDLVSHILYKKGEVGRKPSKSPRRMYRNRRTWNIRGGLGILASPMAFI